MKIFGHSSKNKPQPGEKESKRNMLQGREKKTSIGIKNSKEQACNRKTKYISTATIYDVQGR